MNEQVQQFLAQARQSMQSGQHLQAIEHANQALLLDPTSADAYLIRAVALSQTKQPDAASESFAEAVRLDPTSGKVHYNLAVHQYGLGRRDLAADSVSKALELEPGLGGAAELQTRIATEIGSGPSYQEQAQPSLANPYSQVNEKHLPLIEKLGEDKWRKLGLTFALVNGLMWIISMALTIPVMMQVFSNPSAYQNGNTPQIAGGVAREILAWVLFGLNYGWLLFDLVDKRTKWIWLLPAALCFCIGWVVTLVYILIGRNK